MTAGRRTPEGKDVMRHHFSIRRAGQDVRACLEAVGSDIGLPKRVGDSVFVKPNFTYPFYKEGVTSTREVILALAEMLRDYGCKRVAVGDGEGGYNAFSMDETFANFDLHTPMRHLGVEVVNLSSWPTMTIPVRARGGQLQVPVPRPLFEEFDSFVSLPVPKVHCMTTISCGLKNQWGLIQDVMRIRLHHALPEILLEINRSLPNPSVIVDGTFGLTRNGPMVDGVALPLGWISGCDDVFLNDALICRLMRIPPTRVGHLAHAQRRGVVPSPDSYEVPSDFAEFCSDDFYLRRNMWNRLAKLTWYSPRLNHLVYFSRLSNVLHRVMYLARHKPSELHARGVDWR